MEQNIEQTQQPVKKTKILNYINVFRGLAILLIVAGHTMQFGEINSLTQKISVEIFAGGTALFIFISGFLFQHLSAKYEFKNYLSKKWTNVIQPYLWTAIPGILLCFLFPLSYGNSFDGLNPLLQIPMMLSVGRVHNIPTWFIPMICLFFLSSYFLLWAERKNFLYKLLPIFFAVTIFLPRQDVDYSTVQGMNYTQMYFQYVKYVIMGFIHFFSMYVFGMFCSKYKEIIDKFYNLRVLFWLLMIGSAVLNVFLSLNYSIQNGTVSKIFATILLLAYLKHYDGWLISKEKLNKVLDFIAKYSFGIFFVHWYFFYLYNQIMDLQNVMPIFANNYYLTFIIVFARFVMVTLMSISGLFITKKAITFIKKEANTRSFIGL